MEAILKGIRPEEVQQMPRGLGAVLSKQSTGFWGKVSSSPAYPDFSHEEIPSYIYTFEPWLGCLWGTSCKFCYVRNAALRFYPGGKGSYWYQKWGHWLIPKPNITERLRRQLLDQSGRTRSAYRGAFVFMSAKTDPFLPIPESLEITRRNLDVFMEAEVFLMCQTRSRKVMEDPEIFARIKEMARQRKVGVSFSVSTDLLEEQRQIERAGLAPEQRLGVMARLKEEGIFVSAAVSPLMPYSANFPRLLVESSHHAAVQLLKGSGSGAATPTQVLRQVHSTVPGYKKLDVTLAKELQALGQLHPFSWGINNKGFIGAFLAARRFYG